AASRPGTKRITPSPRKSKRRFLRLLTSESLKGRLHGRLLASPLAKDCWLLLCLVFFREFGWFAHNQNGEEVDNCRRHSLMRRKPA
ncbi:MAG: hypothetical protein RKO24_15890, partial [Candidatus Competibacter sp.]|nr:hypothetical protein [Candidatus Competibacter sp.]